MKTAKWTKLEWIMAIVVVCLVLVIGIFWTIQNRQKIYAQWKKTQHEIRDLYFQLRSLYSLKAKLDEQSLKFFRIVKLILCGILIVLAQWIHWEFGFIFITAFVTALSFVGALYQIIVFAFFVKHYSVSESLECMKNGVTYLFYRAANFEPATILIIEEKIEMKKKEALILKLKLRPEAQAG